jgi:hypothetical protein
MHVACTAFLAAGNYHTHGHMLCAYVILANSNQVPLCHVLQAAVKMQQAFRKLKKQCKDVGWPSAQNP